MNGVCACAYAGVCVGSDVSMRTAGLVGVGVGAEALVAWLSDTLDDVSSLESFSSANITCAVAVAVLVTVAAIGIEMRR